MHTVPGKSLQMAAAAVGRGPLTAAAIEGRLVALGGRAGRRLRRIAEGLARRFETGRRPSAREIELALRQDKGFARVWRRVQPRLDALPPSCMQPGPVAAAWSVPPLVSPPALAAWLGLTVEELHFLARCRTGEAHAYRWRWISRRGGVPRLIEAPRTRLAWVQRRILHGILAHVPAHPAAHGFVRGRDVVSAASIHAGRSCVLRMDVRDFFASFGCGRVRRVFFQMGYPEEVAGLLARLCTSVTPGAVRAAGLAAHGPAAERLERALQRRHLPQGAPTSPALANLCAYRIDARLSGLARRFAADYTRYADDLLFSGAEGFARDARRCELHAAAILLEEGLAAAHHKTRRMPASVSQRALGLVLNAALGVPRRERERLEAILHNCMRHGADTQNREGHPNFRAHLLGRIAQVARVQPRIAARLRVLFDSVSWTPRVIP
ncbi:MAG: reverse transcriptase family protein [Planctomycetota bacterium]